MSETRELPEGWVWTTLGAVILDFVGGGTPSKDMPEYFQGSIPWFSVKDMRSRRPTDSVDHISEQAVLDSATNIIPPDTVIIATRIGLGKVIRVPYEAAINQDLKALITPADLDKGYLEYWILSAAEVLESLGSGTTVKGIRLETLRQIDFPLAPLAEQRRIVAAIEQQFTRLDAGVAALRRARAALKRYRAAVLKAAVDGRLTVQWRAEHPNVEAAPVLLGRILAERRARWEADLRARGKDPTKARYEEPKGPDGESLPELPEGWCWANLDQISILQRGRFSVRPRNDPRYYGGPYPFVQIGDIPDEGGEILTYRQTLNEDGLRVSRMFSAGTVLVSIAAAIGTVGILTFASCFPDSIVGITCSDDALARYVEIYLRTQKDQLKAKSYASGGQPNINLPVLQAYTIPLPSLAEQEQIVAEVERRLSVVGELEATVEANLKRAERLRQSILREAFAGRLVAQDASDEPAGVLVERIRGERARANGDRRAVETAPEGAARHETRLRGLGEREGAVEVVGQVGLWGEDGG